MSRRLSVNQMQMLLTRGDNEEDDSEEEDGMASEDDSEDDGEEDANQGYDEASGDGSEVIGDVRPLMRRRLSSNQLQMLLNRGDYEEDAESDAEASDAEESDAEESDAEASDADASDASSEAHSGDGGAGKWPTERGADGPGPTARLSAEARRERYAVALMAAAKLKGGGLGPKPAGALKDLALLDDGRVMGPVDAFLANEDFEVLVEQLHAVAVGAASMA